ncbi:MAG: TPP-dependent acetoin dehydrogenase complex, E1 protein subunit beta [Candidatus Tectimicrobiota bacterium]|nr:MAG: TPP-dependent acetoin dehydrogenase complex, E1 protein subunit beta [Candidatus Tectomicrobia bacterium]
MPKVSFREAIRDALLEEMERDESIFILGEDVIAHGGPYAVTRGIYEKFPHRIRQTPISEAAIVGTAVGAALCGVRPVAEIMYVDFVTCAMDEVVNQMAKIRYMFGGQTDVPVVLRLPSGSARLIAAQHSQALEAWFVHVPGLQVVVPSTPYDAKGLMKTALRGRDPVIYIEYKRLYSQEGEVPEGDYTIPFGQADIKREGRDVTIVATGPMVGKALEAAEILAQEGIEVEVVDPRTLVPLDKETIFASVHKTNRVIVTDEEAKRAGTSAEIAALIAEECFDALDAPVKRVAAANVPMPFSPELEKLVVPKAEHLVAAVRELLG